MLLIKLFSNGDTDIENRLMNMGVRGRRRGQDVWRK